MQLQKPEENGVVKKVDVLSGPLSRVAGSFEWFGTVDELVKFVYGNQGLLFKQNAVLFRRTGGIYTIHSETTELMPKSQRVRGSWE